MNWKLKIRVKDYSDKSWSVAGLESSSFYTFVSVRVCIIIIFISVEFDGFCRKLCGKKKTLTCFLGTLQYVTQI